MDTESLQKFCPVCKLANESDAIFCKHCGASFIKGPEAPTTRRVDKDFELTEALKEQITRAYPPPAKGLLLFLLNSSEPIALFTEPEFTLGRGGALNTGPIFDLSEFNAFAMGVSRSHVMIKAVGNKYVVMDLNSSNGTWLNGERLLPHREHDLPNAGVIQLGRLQLLVIYTHTPLSE